VIAQCLPSWNGRIGRSTFALASASLSVRVPLVIERRPLRRVAERTLVLAAERGAAAVLPQRLGELRS